MELVTFAINEVNDNVGGAGFGSYKRYPSDDFKQLQSFESQGADKLFTTFQIGLQTGCHLEILGAPASQDTP